MKRRSEIPDGGPPVGKLGQRDCRKGSHGVIHAAPLGVRHLQIPSTLGTRTVEEVGCPTWEFGEKGSDGPGEGGRCPVPGVRSRGGEVGQEGRGRRGAGEPGEEGRGAFAAPSPRVRSPLLPSLSTRHRAHPAKARPLQGEAPNRRGAGPRPCSNGDAGGGADAVWAGAEVGPRDSAGSQEGALGLKQAISDTPGAGPRAPAP